MAGISKAERARRAAERNMDKQVAASAPPGWRKKAPEFVSNGSVRFVSPEEEAALERVKDLERELNDRADQWAASMNRHATTMAQRDYLIGYANRLLDRFVGVQLLHGLTTIDAAVAFTNAEKAAAEAELQAIKARYTPEPPEVDAVMPELRERFTDAKQGIGEESYPENWAG